MTISEKKMQIVIDNYFKSECDVNTSIRQAFEKGFRIGIKKVPSTEPERKKGKWIDKSDGIEGAWNYCSVCGEQAIDLYDFCPNCGSYNGGEQE